MTTPFRISAKNLGKLSLSNCCERCFWILSHLGFRAPWFVFPGIFSSLDSYQKRCIHEFFRQHGALPEWLAAFGDLREPVPVPHHSQFQWLDEESGVLLTGAPDDIYWRHDESLFIVDFKTARLTDGQDALSPLYEVQLNSYAYLAERLGMGSVTGLGLVYFEPLTETDDIDTWLSKNGFDLGFSAKAVAVAKNQEQIPALLRRARTIFDAPIPTTSLGCRDCALVTDLARLEKGCC